MAETALIVIRMRWFVLTVLSVLGAVLFLPFLKAVARGGISLGQESVFTIIVTVLSALSIWAGLRFADQAGLPMPLLPENRRGLAGRGRYPPLRKRSVAFAVILD